ncbi:MAG: hypothetical protein HYZ20_04770 [Burkholderiales bacterium]|nr:hypothetical protein [Burkholderiales bacterium]
MTASPGFAYAQARLQARHAGLPGTALWSALEATRSLPAYLSAARGSTLARWVETLGADADARRIEQRLQAQWQAEVYEVAGWLPTRWQPAVQWFGGLPALPLADDAAARPAEVAAEWRREWGRRLPRQARPAAETYARPAEWLLPGLRAGAAGLRAAGDPEVEQRLERLFRREAGGPLAVLAHLGRLALVVERLRGGLVARAVVDRGATAPEAA